MSAAAYLRNGVKAAPKPTYFDIQPPFLVSENKLPPINFQYNPNKKIKRFLCATMLPDDFGAKLFIFLLFCESA